MAETPHLPLPSLSARRFGARRIPALTDEALFEQTGVRIAFTEREGGASKGAFSSFNLGSHVGDNLNCVVENRLRLLEALDASNAQLIVPNQVHGDRVVLVDDADPACVDAARRQAEEGADALVVSVQGIAALLCFADCVPVIVVSPTSRFAVVHAGWRGVVSAVAVKAVRELAAADEAGLGPSAAAAYNVYVGPHIHAECFETGEDVRALFADRFGEACAPDQRHVDLSAALTASFVEAGIDRRRIEDAGICTACEPARYYSYRALGGVCGRHGAFACRKAG